MSEFVLVIAQQSTFLYQLSGGKATRVASAQIGEDVKPWIERYLPQGTDCSLVTDIMDEIYVQTTLPVLWIPSTRQQLLQRRLIQQLRDTPYRAAVLLPSGSFKPPTRAIFIGTGQSERIKEFVTLLIARRVRLKGLWPLSALIAIAANSKEFKSSRTQRMKPKSSPGLQPSLALVAVPSGLRQALMSGKTPMFSRLALSASESGLLANYVLSEARRTVQYLMAQQWLGAADQPVATQLWLPAADDAALLEAANDAALDVQMLFPTADAYLFLLPQVKKVSPVLQLLPAANRLAWQAAQLGRGAIAVGALALVAATLWSAGLAWESWRKTKRTDLQIAQAAAINQQARLEVLQAKGDLSQAGLAVVSVQAWEKNIQAQPSQLAGLQHVAAALQSVPGLSIEKIRWDLPPLEGDPNAAPTAFGCPKPVVVDAAAAAPSDPPAPGTVKAAVAMINLSLRLPEDVTQRQALALQTKMAAQLGTNKWLAVVTKSSIDFEPDQTQTGSVGKPSARVIEMCLEKAAK